MTDARYAMGPVNVVARDWPASWYAYAQEHYAPARARVPEVVVTCSATGEDPTGRSIETTVSELVVEPHGEGWRIESATCFSAALDETHRWLHIDVWAQLDVPHVTLGNALRGLVHLLLPLDADGLMFHAASGVLDGRGVAFAGVSTAGKTTLALGMRDAKFLSDDISLVRDLSRRPMLLASPFFGSAGRRGHNLDAPLAAFGLLEKDPHQTRIERLGGKEAVMHLLRHAVSFSKAPGFVHRVMENVTALAEKVPIVLVHRHIETPSDEVARRVLAEVAAS